MKSMLLTITIIVSSIILFGFLWGAKSSAKKQPLTPPDSFYDISIQSIEGDSLDLNQFKGKVVLVVNVASRCGYTPQYKGLEEMYQSYREKGLVILGVPSNDFMGQEPGTAEEIQSFCQLNYGVTFPLTEKIHVKGRNQHPLYQYLVNQSSFKGEISWNFNKIVLDKKGNVVKRFGSMVKPTSKQIVGVINQYLE